MDPKSSEAIILNNLYFQHLSLCMLIDAAIGMAAGLSIDGFMKLRSYLFIELVLLLIAAIPYAAFLLPSFPSFLEFPPTISELATLLFGIFMTVIIKTAVQRKV